MSLWPPRFRAPAATLALGLDLRQLAWIKGESAAAEISTADHAEGVIAALVDAPDGAQLDIIAAADVAKHWLQVPPSSVRSLRELKLVAAARCAHLYGGSAGDWWVTGDWNSRRPFACAALPHSVAAPLASQFATRRGRVRWRTTWAIACSAFPAEFPADGWSALVSPAHAVVWHCRNGDVNCMGTVAIDPLASQPQRAEFVLQHIEVESRRCTDAPVANVHWLDLTGRKFEGSMPRIHWILRGANGVHATGSEAAAAIRLHRLPGQGAR